MELQSPASAQLDALAKQHGVTVTGSGHQDIFWVQMVTLLMGASHRIDTVHGRVSWNADEYGADVIKSKHVGKTVQEFQRAMASEAKPPTYGRNVLGATLATLGLTATRWTSTVTPVISDVPRASRSLGETFAPGTVIGYSDVDTVETLEGPTFTFEMAGYVYAEGETDKNEWRIEGEPNLELSNGAVPTSVTTCTQWVNRIPDVINAPPGLVTVDRLPLLQYRARPLHTYVHRGQLL